MTEPTKTPNPELLTRVLVQMREAGRPMFNHEFNFKELGVSENNLASRWCEWARLGLVHSPHGGKNGMKAWAPGPDPRGVVARHKPSPVIGTVVGEAMVKGYYIVSARQPLAIGASLRTA